MRLIAKTIRMLNFIAIDYNCTIYSRLRESHFGTQCRQALCESLSYAEKQVAARQMKSAYSLIASAVRLGRSCYFYGSTTLSNIFSSTRAILELVSEELAYV